jgi:hypothetical protein
MAKVNITFKPKQTTKKLLKGLQDRASEVIVNRFGLNDSGEQQTLESIGQKYGITRERVRQIENFALNAIKKSDSFHEAEEIFKELKDVIQTLGGIVSEEELLPMLSKDQVTQNHIGLYLALGNDFTEAKEDAHFKKRWVVDGYTAERVHKALLDIHGALASEDLISESEMIDKVLCHDGICEITSHKVDNEMAGGLRPQDAGDNPGQLEVLVRLHQQLDGQPPAPPRLLVSPARDRRCSQPGSATAAADSEGTPRSVRPACHKIKSRNHKNNSGQNTDSFISLP